MFVPAAAAPPVAPEAAGPYSLHNFGVERLGQSELAVCLVQLA
jgi:hypothetical protein